LKGVSAVLATKNNEKTIDQALRSVIINGCEEIILVDGNSTDKTLDKVSKYPNIKIIKGIQGIGKGKDIGWRSAKNELVLFLDADAYIDKNTVHKLASYLGKNDVAGICCRVSCANKDKLLPRLKDFYFKQIYAKQFKKSHVIKSDADPTICGLFKKSLLMAIEGFDVSYPFAEDLKLLKKFQKSKLRVLMTYDAVVFHHHREKSREVYVQHYCHGYGRGLLDYELGYEKRESISLKNMLEFVKRITKQAPKDLFAFIVYPAYFIFIEFAFRLGYHRGMSSKNHQLGSSL
jgi:glycosyltransferase involved in cell wall biosynthesis